MASGNRLAYLDPLSARQPTTLFPSLGVRTGGSTPAEVFDTLDYDGSAIEYADWKVRLPEHYAGGGLTLSLEWAALSATTGDAVWGAAIRRFENDAEDMDAAHTYDYNNAAAVTTASATGETVKSAITFTSGADMDSWAAGEMAWVRIRRVPTDAGDTIATDCQFLNCIIKET